MPFAKRIVEPQWLCRRADADEEGLLLQDLCAFSNVALSRTLRQLSDLAKHACSRADADEEGLLLQDLCAFSNVALSRTLRQLSDLAKHACSLFQELEHELLATNRRVCALREKMSMIQETTGALDPKQEAVPLSNLDIESKLSGHYQAPWHLQRNVFLPSTRPACVEELHRNAKQSLRALESRLFFQFQEADAASLCSFLCLCSSSYSCPFLCLYCCHFSPWSRKVAPPVDSDSEVVALGHWPKCPIPNVPSMLDKQTNWAGILPLPTPEEKMKTDSQVINSCIVPINVTGVGFDREASVRCSLVHSQSVLQRRRKLRRRKTITGIPRRVQQDFDSDESPVARERTVMVHNNPEICQEDLTLSRLNTKDSGCQTEESLIVGAAPSRRRIRAQRGQGVTVSLSHSTGNISSLPDNSDTMFTASVGSRLRSRSLPREGGRLVDEGHDNSDEDDEEEDEEELSAFEAEDFLPVPGEHILKDDEESTDDQAIPEGQHNSLKFKQHAGSTEHDWIERGRSHLPRKADMGSCEISSSSDTFSSPIHSVSNAGVLTSQMDHKEDHQSSSGNWSGSSSTCPSQTSETIPPAASPPLTGSSHCDSELSLNAATNTNDDSTGFIVDPYPGDRSQGLHSHRTGSLTSTATDMLDDAGVSTASEGEWSYPHYRHNMPCHPDFSPEHSRAENILESPSFASIATFESLTDRPPSEKADTTSHFSVDAEGYYTSMHFDCGLKGSKSFTYNYTCIDKQQAEYGHQTSTLGRCSLSLRKPKVKPSPPKRSSSLKKISSHVGPPTDKNEPKNAVGQNKSMSSGERTQHVGLNRGSSSQLESEEPLGAWGVESSTEIPEVALSGSTETHSFKDEGAVQSDYADLWLLNDLKSNDPYRSLSNSSTATGTTVIECIKSQESSESQTSQSESRATTPSLPSVESEYRLPSPEKLVGLASPSSGYSSQSETPTSSLPSAFFPNAHPMSPTGGKRKPKVPERKSSLASFQKYSSKRDLELPIIPPSHLDLSALPNVSKPSIHTNQMHILDQSKQKLAVTSSLAITPTVLRSVQLRSVGKSGEGSHDRPITDTATRPKCPTVTIITPPTHDKPHETRKPPPYRPLFIETTSQDNCKSLFTPVDGLAAKNIASHFVAEDVSTSNNLFPQSSLELEQIQPWKSEPNEGSPCQNGLGKRSDGLDQVPDIVNQRSETLQAYLISSAEEESITSGVPTRSASQELVEEGVSISESTPSDPTESPLTDKSKTEDDSVFLSPSKSRTTEDLFAMIHRSKRKMLGRKDSEEMSVRSRLAVVSGNGSATNPATSPSTPNMPASPSTQTGAQRTPGSIYRSAKKSSTSNEEFKLLLLKKGSRSDSSYRMSATEILKSPVAPKSPGELLKEGSRPFEEPLSPFQQQLPEGTPEQMPSPFPKSYAEGFSPKAFPTSASTRQGRSRMPPAANSSRYSTRSRLYIAPMQAISEGETENSDGSPHDDRSS
uniref:Nance-Horan syndrome protein-like n=1 Tax=Sinocyclocheilus anshuiensis TaxID=1608454 RepID=A0A671NCS5_9TELE